MALVGLVLVSEMFTTDGITRSTMSAIEVEPTWASAGFGSTVTGAALVGWSGLASAVARAEPIRVQPVRARVIAKDTAEIWENCVRMVVTVPARAPNAEFRGL